MRGRGRDATDGMLAAGERVLRRFDGWSELARASAHGGDGGQREKQTREAPVLRAQNDDAGAVSASRGRTWKP